ncbi:Golgi organization [Mactra antiquata]
MQHDINRLRNDLRQVQTECQHWRSLANKQNVSDNGTLQSLEEKNDDSLKQEIQELQRQLSHEKDLRQQELSSLQDAQTHKISQMRKKHKEEISNLKAKIQEMEWGSDGWETQKTETPSHLNETIQSLQEELSTLKSEKEAQLKEINFLSKSVSEYQSELAIKQAHSLHMENQLKVAKEEIKRLEEERDQADTLEVLSNLRDVRQHMDMNAIDRRNKLLMEKDKLVNLLITSSVKKKELEKDVDSLSVQSQVLRNETTAMVQDLGNVEQQKLTAGIIDTLEKENLLLKEKNVGLQEQVTLLEKALQNASREKLSTNQDLSGLTDSETGDDLLMVSDTASVTSDLSEMSRRNVELDELVHTLKSQISNYESEISQFELLQSDWMNEKETLEGVLVELRTQLKAKENSLNIAEAQKGLLAVAKHEASLTALPDLVEPKSSPEAPSTSIYSMVEVSDNDVTGDSMVEIAEEVEELDRKVGLLTEANAQLEMERDQLKKEKNNLQKELNVLRSRKRTESETESKPSDDKGKPVKDSYMNDLLREKEEELQLLMNEKEDLEKTVAEVPELKQQLQQKESEMEEQLMSQKVELETFESEVQELKKKLRGKNEEIVNLSLEKEEMMSSLEELDNQHQEAIGHVIQIKDQLSKSNDELKTKIANLEEDKHTMQIELDKLKSQHMVNQTAESSSSNELNHQIAELKDETAELRRNLDKSNNIIKKLEADLNTKDENLNEMQLKLMKSAESLNDLHMDKQELLEKINKYKTDMNNQSAKLKLLRDENEHLKHSEIKEGEHLQGDSQSSNVAEINLLEEQIQKLNLDLENLQDKLKTKSNECKELFNDKKQIEIKLGGCEKQCEEKDNEILTMKEKVNDLETNVEKLRCELESSTQDCRNFQKECDKKHEECESFSTQLHSLEHQIHSLKADITAKDHNIENLSSQLTKANDEIQACNDKYNKKSDECVKLTEEINQVKNLLEDSTDRLHSKCEECQELIEKVERLKIEVNDLQASANDEYEIMRITGELSLVKEDLANTTEEWKRLDKELYAKDEVIKNLEELNRNMQKEKDHVMSEFESVKAALNSKDEEIVTLNDHNSDIEKQKGQLSTELESVQKTLNDENVTLKSEVSKLTKDLSNLDQAMKDQKQHYEKYIEEIKSVQQNDATSQEAQYSEMLEKCHKKDLQISEMDAKLANVFSQLEECQTELNDTQEKYQCQLNECDAVKEEILVKKSLVEKLSSENMNLSDSIKQFEMSALELNETREKIASLEAERNAFESEIQKQNSEKLLIIEESKSEKDKLNSHIKELQSQLDAYSHSRTEQQGESEMYKNERDSLVKNVESLEAEVVNLKNLISNHEAGISDLNAKRAETLQDMQDQEDKMKSQDDLIAILKQTSVQKDEEIGVLQRKLSRAKSFIDEENIKHIDNDMTPHYNLPALEYQSESSHAVEKGNIVSETMEKCESVQKLGTLPMNSDINGEHSKHECDVLAEIERLQEQLSEKDSVINELQRNNASLLKMLDSKSKSQGDNSLLELHKLENEVKLLKTEREQMMDVLNEKSRECSSLKAECQRLMNIVSAQKAALEKLQKDNQELMNKSQDGDGVHIDDMQKETVKNLSRIIRDKDLEIESLTQKNQTLLSVLQESSNEGTELTSLMQDKENLGKQLNQLQSEREQMITYLNQKHQESVAYHAEVQRLSAYINSENEKNEKMKLDYERLVPQYEDNKQSLLKTQNELINYKQKYQEMEVKYGHMIQQTESGETTDKALYDSKCEENNRLHERYKELMDVVKEKDVKIQSLHQQISDLEQTYRTCDSERANFKKQVDGFTFQIHGLQTEQTDLKAEIAKLKQTRDSSADELHVLNDMNNKLTLQVQDKEFEIQSLQEKMKSLTSIIQQQQGEKGQLEHVMHENEATQRHIKQLTMERDQALLGLQQQQENNNKLLKNIQSLEEKNAKLNRELDRLRQHLIQIEDGYTKEAIAAEEREKDLRTRLATAEENVYSSSSAVESANQQASQQVDSLQQQLHFVSQQRDQAYLQISSLQEQNQMYSSSMTNLQMVLEEFQQEKDRLVAEETERLVKEVTSLRSQGEKLKADLKYTKDQLEEASDGLEAASRLSEQLDKKEEAIDALREEVQVRESALKVAEDEVKAIKSRNDDRVDKLVIKNLFLGYFTTPQNKRHEVLRAIGGVLLFTSEDFQRIEGTNSGGWVPGFLKFSGNQKQQQSPPTTPVRRSTIGAAPVKADNSFSQMFVKFLERESSPPPPTVRLPAEEMVQDIQKQRETHKPVYNPFTAPRHVAMPTSNTSTIGSHKPQHILMSSAVSMSQTLPTFAAPSESSRTPPGSGRNTPSAATTSGAILKDVLGR